MANVGFGITQLDIVGSGTPTLQSASNLDITATTTAFSGGATFGGNVELNSGTDLRIQLNSSEGAIELSRASGGAYIDFKNSTSCLGFGFLFKSLIILKSSKDNDLSSLIFDFDFQEIPTIFSYFYSLNCSFIKLDLC